MSSPLIDVQQRQLYVTTLAGHVVAINCVSNYNSYVQPLRFILSLYM